MTELPDILGEDLGYLLGWVALGEQVGEVATALNDREHDHAKPNRPQEWHDGVEDNAVADLRHELLQVAAMAVAWIAALDDEALA